MRSSVLNDTPNWLRLGTVFSVLKNEHKSSKLESYRFVPYWICSTEGSNEEDFKVACMLRELLNVKNKISEFKKVNSKKYRAAEKWKGSWTTESYFIILKSIWTGRWKSLVHIKNSRLSRLVLSLILPLIPTKAYFVFSNIEQYHARFKDKLKWSRELQYDQIL